MSTETVTRPATAEDLLAFEARMKEAKKWRRYDVCEALGVSQGKWRRMVEGEVRVDKTTALAISAISFGLPPYPEKPTGSFA